MRGVDNISSWVKKPNRSKRKSVFNKQNPQIIENQWATGYVKSVIVNSHHPEYTEPRDINAIIAIVHGDNLEATSGGLIAGSIFYPLMRGMVDVPVKGDQVLLCHFGGIPYYMGPLNTVNKPCFNPDGKFDEIVDSGYDPFANDDVQTELTGPYVNEGGSRYFPQYCPNRLQKPYIHVPIDLDGVGHLLPTNMMAEAKDPNMAKLKEIHGDMLFEGRHGSSIRLGSRNDSPLVIISNRDEDAFPLTYERTVGGSILAMLRRGNIHLNFEEGIGSSQNDDPISGFKLSNDITTAGKIRVGEDAKYGIGAPLYDYSWGLDTNPGDQILLRSDKITIDSNKDSIFLTARRGVVIGSGLKSIIKANDSIHLESEQIFLGGNHTGVYTETPADKFEPMVLGTQLKEALETFLASLKSMQVLTQIGPQDAKKIITSDGSLDLTIGKLEQSLEKILSQRHFIEAPEE